MASHHIFRLADALPQNLPQLFSVVTPITSIVRDRAAELLQVVQTAVEEAVTMEAKHPENTPIVNRAGLATLPEKPTWSINLPDVWAKASTSSKQPYLFKLGSSKLNLPSRSIYSTIIRALTWLSCLGISKSRRELCRQNKLTIWYHSPTPCSTERNGGFR